MLNYKYFLPFEWMDIDYSIQSERLVEVTDSEVIRLVMVHGIINKP